MSTCSSLSVSWWRHRAKLGAPLNSCSSAPGCVSPSKRRRSHSVSEGTKLVSRTTTMLPQEPTYSCGRPLAVSPHRCAMLRQRPALIAGAVLVRPNDAPKGVADRGRDRHEEPERLVAVHPGIHVRYIEGVCIGASQEPPRSLGFCVDTSVFTGFSCLSLSRAAPSTPSSWNWCSVKSRPVSWMPWEHDLPKRRRADRSCRLQRSSPSDRRPRPARSVAPQLDRAQARSRWREGRARGRHRGRARVRSCR